MSTVNNIVGDNFAKMMRFLSRKLRSKYFGGHPRSFLLDLHRYLKEKKFNSENSRIIFSRKFHADFFSKHFRANEF
jgi:hypothetical protein